MFKRTSKGLSTLVTIFIIAVFVISGIIFRFCPRFDRFILSDYPSTVYSGQEFTIKVSAVDQSGTLFSSYSGSVFFTSTDNNAILADPGDINNPYTFDSNDQGVHTFTGFQLTSTNENETFKISVSDGKKTATSNPITVLQNPSLDHFEFNPINSPQTTGFDFKIKVKAVDQYGDICTSYTGTPTLTYSEGSITPSLVTSWSNGIGQATVKVIKAGSQCTIAINDGAITGVSNGFNVDTTSSSSFLVDAKATVWQDEPFTVTVVGLDDQGHADFNYLGSIHFSSDTPGTILPSNYTFLPSDMGMHMFQVTLNTPGNITIIVNDVLDPTRKGALTRYVHEPMPQFIGIGMVGSKVSATDLYTLNPSYPMDLQANDLIILHTVGVTYQPLTPPGFSVLYGPDQNGPVVQWLFYKFANGSESGDLVFNYPGDCMKMSLIYNFRGVSPSNFIESGVYGSGNSSLIEAPSVTTTGKSRLAVSFVFVGAYEWTDIDLPFIGSSGGVWNSPFGDCTIGSNAHPIHLSLQLQVAQMPDENTLSGGSIQLINTGYWGVRSFCLIP